MKISRIVKQSLCTITQHWYKRSNINKYILLYKILSLSYLLHNVQYFIVCLPRHMCVCRLEVREFGFSVIVDGRSGNWANSKLILRTLQVSVTTPSPMHMWSHDHHMTCRRLCLVRSMWCIWSSRVNSGRSSRQLEATTKRKPNWSLRWGCGRLGEGVVVVGSLVWLSCKRYGWTGS